MVSIAKANTNIALVKYWGKKNSQLNLPTAGSIGLTLNNFYTKTSVTIDQNLQSDQLIINGKNVDASKANKLLSVIRKNTGISHFSKITSENNMPISAGFASSASAFAALAAAAAKEYGYSSDLKDLSILARIGSGSAARSIFGGFTLWHEGSSSKTSFAESINSEKDLDIIVIDLLFEEHKKNISSTKGMEIAKTSPNYPSWIQQTNNDLVAMEKAIQAADIEQIGWLAEQNSLMMHEVNRTAIPPFDYFSSQTANVLDRVKKLRKQGILAFSTIDAGPNVKVISDSKNQQKIIEEFSDIKSSTASIGSGVEILL